MEIVWSHEAEKSFKNILVYLLENWTKKEALKFMVIFDGVLNKMSNNPELFKVSLYNKTCREALITKHTTLFYRVHNDKIELITFWGNFQDSHPKLLTY